MSLEIKRLHLGATPGDTERWPVHGFVVTYHGGVALVDTGAVSYTHLTLPTTERV